LRQCRDVVKNFNHGEHRGHKDDIEVGCRPPGGNVGGTYRHADRVAGTAKQSLLAGLCARKYFLAARNRPAVG